MKTLRSIISAMCVLALCGAALAQTTINSSLSGRITNPRQLQLGMKLTF